MRCPSQALFFGTLEQIEQLRPMSAPTNVFRFGNQTITTRVFTMVPRRLAAKPACVDVTAAMEERPPSRAIPLRVIPARGAAPPAPADVDPFAEVEIP